MIARMVSVVGFKDSGKTTVVEGVVRELVKRGYRVGTAKHVGDPSFSFDRRGTDTWRHAQAGASKVVCVADGEITQIEKKEVRLPEVLRLFQDADFFILEGFRGLPGIPRVVVARNTEDAERLVDRLTLATVGVRVAGLPYFTIGDLIRLAELVEERAIPPLPGLNCRKCGFEKCEEFAAGVVQGKAKWSACAVLGEDTVLRVDGMRIPLNPFLRGLLKNLVEAFTASLKAPRGGRVVIEAEFDDR